MVDSSATALYIVIRRNPASTGFPVGGEGIFNMCSFWLVEALTRAGQADAERLDQARLLFERVLGYATSRTLRGTNRATTRGSGQLPAGFYTLSTDQRSIQSGPNVG